MTSPDWYKRYQEKKFYPTYPDEIVKEFKNAIRSSRIAEIYAHRIDRFLSGDDSEEYFIKKLKEDLNKFNKSQKGD